MAQRRMFSLKIIDTDLFLDMPNSAQLLYFHLSMRADDDGFISSPKKIMKIVGCSDDDLKILFVKGFVIPFESGICIIKHWKIHNYIQKDRYTPTMYKDEMDLLTKNENGVYEKSQCIQNGYKTGTQVRLGKDRLESGKVKEKTQIKFDNDSFEILTVNYLIDKILKLNPNAKIPKTLEEKQKWAVHIDRMKNLDNRNEEDIKRVLKFATENIFWQQNILSTKKLREKFDTLYIQMNGSKIKSKNIFLDIAREESL